MITCNETIYQWDVSRTVDVDTDCEVHFALQGEPQALVIASALGKAEIPNILLQDGRDIIAWKVQEDKTVETKRIAVMRRAKPADYVYTETEIITFETLVAEVREAVAKALEQTERAEQAVSTIEKTNADIQQAETKRAEEFKAMGAKTDAGIAKMNKAESDVRQAEEQRVEQEFSRTQAEAKREESFTSNLTSWNQKVDAEVAKTSQAITETNKAKDNAITATNKANEAIAQLPLPTGNVLKGEVRGTIARTDDTYSSTALGFSVYGKSEQITTTGANKFNPAGITNGSSNGLTWKKNENGSITISGTSTALVNINLVANPSEFILSTGKWTGSVKGADKAKLVVQTLDGTQICNTNTSATRENKTEQGLKYFLLQVQAQTTLNETIFVFLEKSDKALYEEYTDGKPSPSPKFPREITNVANADLSIMGKNLIEKAIVDSHTARFATVLKLKMKLSPSTQYCLNFEDVKDNAYYLNETVFEYQRIATTGSRQFLLVRTKDVLDKNNRLQFDSINDCWIVLKNGKEQSNAPQFKNVQFELGSDNTPYEAPSKPIALPINLQGNELCSLPNGVRDEVRIDKDGNVELVKRVKKAVMDGSADEDWRRNGENDTNVRFYIVFDDKAFGTPRMEHVVSDRFSSKNVELAERETLRLVEIGLPKSIVPTLDISLLRAWLAKNPTTFIYKLATPIITTLGKIDMPTLPAPVCNAWANDENPTDVKFSYIRDVNIAYEKLASALANAMNTPTTIPELEL